MKNTSPFDHPAYKALTTDEAKINYFLDQMKDLFPDKAQLEVIRTEALKLYALGCDSAKANGATVEDFISFIAEEMAVSLLMAELELQTKAAGQPTPAPDLLFKKVPTSQFTQDMHDMVAAAQSAPIKVNTTLPQHSNN